LELRVLADKRGRHRPGARLGLLGGLGLDGVAS
jgi:hypothetical protein